MPTIKNVAHIGATGNVGVPVLSALIASGRFNLTVITRPESSRTFPEGVTVRTADYDSHTALVEALKGQDALVITTGAGPSGDQVRVAAVERTVISAAIEAGVKHIIPNDYAGDLAHEPARSHEIFAPKVINQNYVKSLADEGKITFTSIEPGPFFDWGLVYGFLMVDLVNKKATIIDDGTIKVNLTTMDSVCTAVVNAVSNPDIVKNRGALIHDFYVSGKEVLAVLEEELGTKFEVNYTTPEAHIAEPNPLNLLQASVWGKESSCSWGVDDDSKALGLVEKNLREEVVKVLKAQGLKA